jgi:hypothetical protein
LSFDRQLLEEFFCKDHPVFAANCFGEQIGILRTRGKEKMCETYIKGLLLQHEKILKKGMYKK